MFIAPITEVCVVLIGSCWRSRTGKVVDLFDLRHVGVDYVVPYDFEIGVFQQVPDIAFVPGKIVVDADHVVSFVKQSFT